MLRLQEVRSSFGWLLLVRIAVIFLFTVVGVIIYSNTFEASFHFDDQQTIVHNPLIRDFSEIGRLWRFSSRRFVTYWTFIPNFKLGGLGVYGYHVVNLLIHIFSSYLAYLLTLLTFRTTRMQDHPLQKWAQPAALFVGLIFLCHPLQTQAVTYIIQRAASLAALFYLAALVCYAKFRLTGGWIYYFNALLMTLICVYTKEHAYTLPLAICLYELMFFGLEKKELPRRVMSLAVFFLPLVLVYFTIYHKAVQTGGFEQATRALGKVFPRHHYLFTEFNVIRTYLRLLIFPAGQNMDYDYPISTNFFEPRTIASFLLLAGLLTLGAKLYKKDKLISFGIFWFFLTLSIESSIFQIEDVIFEHRLYLPMLGFGMVLVSVGYLFLKNFHQLAVGLTVVVLIFSILTYSRNSVWSNDITLW